MENPDSIEYKFKTTLSGLEQEPPAHVWQNLKAELSHGSNSESATTQGPPVFHLPDRKLWNYIAMAGAVLLLFLSIVYIAANDHHSIKGHAYAGEARLCRGVAVLFSVEDKARPWDSVKHYRSSAVDKNGYYHFSEVDPGVYLLRIAPESFSETAESFLPSWFDQITNPKSSHVIIVDEDDINADVHLMTRKKEKK